MNRIAIWTPINSTSGFGHFYRMLGLYEALKSDSYPIYYFTNADYILTENINLLNIYSNDIEDIISFLIKKEIKILIIDNYQITKKNLLLLNAKFKLIYFDSEFRNMNIDCLINFNPYAKTKYIKVHPGTKYFLGLEHMVFRNSITKAIKCTPIKDTVFISIGGSDVSSTTYNIIPYLPKDKIYNIVLGKGCSRDYSTLVKNNAIKNNLSFKVFHHPDNYFEILQSSELAIISCSTSSYEMIYFSKPFICINIINNQNEISEYLAAKGISTLTKDNIIKLSDIINNKVKFNKNLTIRKSFNNKLISYIKGLSNAKE